MYVVEFTRCKSHGNIYKSPVFVLLISQFSVPHRFLHLCLQVVAIVSILFTADNLSYIYIRGTSIGNC